MTQVGYRWLIRGWGLRVPTAGKGEGPPSSAHLFADFAHGCSHRLRDRAWGRGALLPPAATADAVRALNLRRLHHGWRSTGLALRPIAPEH